MMQRTAAWLRPVRPHVMKAGCDAREPLVFENVLRGLPVLCETQKPEVNVAVVTENARSSALTWVCTV